MYLRTPKRYTSKGRRRYLINLRWLWLYLLAPVIIIPAALAFNYRAELSGVVANFLETSIPSISRRLNPPTPTPTIPAADLNRIFVESVQSGRVENAISALSGLADNAPNDVSIHAMLTRIILLRGDDDDREKLNRALEAATMTVNANPEAVDGWIMLALATNKNGEPDRALAYALRARDLDEKNPLLLAVTADIYDELELYEQAIQYADQAIEAARAAQPINTLALAYAYWIKGSALSNTSGQLALDAYEEAWRAAVTDASVPLGFIALALYPFYRDERKEELIQMLSQAAERDKDDPTNLLFLGVLYIRDANWDRARPAIARCLDLNPNHVRCLRRYSQIFYNLENYVQAAEHAQKAVNLNTSEPQAYLLAGLSYIRGPGKRCGDGVPLLQKGYIMMDESQTLADFEKDNMRRQFVDGLTTCNARPLQPTRVPTLTAVATFTPDAPPAATGTP